MKTFLYLLLAVVANSNDLKICSLDTFGITDGEDKISAHFDNLIKQNTQITFGCFEFLIQRGFYKTAAEVYDKYFIPNDINIIKQIQALLDRDHTLENIKEIQSIYKHLLSKYARVQTVVPVINWAQSKNRTLINIKFSHRLDSPACLNTLIEELSIEDTYLIVRAFGIVSHLPIRYESRINLYKPVNKELSFHKQEAVGTMLFNLTKLEPNDIWLRLTIENVKIPIWWDMRDNLKDDMDEYIKLLEEESEKKEKQQEKKYQKKNKQRYAEKDRLDRLFALEQQRLKEFEHNQCYLITNRCENGWYQRQ